MSINRAPYNALVDDDGSNTVGSIWNKQAIKNVLLDPIDVALLQAGRVVQRSTLAGVQHDFSLAQPGIDTLLVFTQSGLLTLDGIAGGVDGQIVTILAAGGQIDLAHYSGSAAANRFYNTAATGKTSLSSPNGFQGKATYQYEAGAAAWRLIMHEQGAWIVPPFNAANFSVPSGSWTVDAGDVLAYAYQLRGRTLSVALYLATTSVSGTPGYLIVTIPGGFTAAAGGYYATPVTGNEGGYLSAFAQIGPGTTQILLLKNTGNWATATNTTGVYGTFSFEVG